jgi:hypothetical protein
LSSEFEQPDYQDLYENHSHQKSNDKLGATLIFPLSQRRKDRRGRRRLRQNRVFVLATLNTIQKVLEEGFEYKDIVILTRKRSQELQLLII